VFGGKPNLGGMAMKMKHESSLAKPLHVLLVEDKDSGFWSAQCLEFDIATQAKSYEEILQEVPRVLRCHMAYAERHKMEPFSNLKSAPSAYWKMYYYAETTDVQPASSMKEPMINTSIEGRILQPC
jgi:predicted RNase H-like HicB family nuclease